MIHNFLISPGSTKPFMFVTQTHAHTVFIFSSDILHSIDLHFHLPSLIAESQRHHVQEENPDSPLPTDTFQLVLWNPEAFSDQRRCTSLPATSGSYFGPPTSGNYRYFIYSSFYLCFICVYKLTLWGRVVLFVTSCVAVKKCWHVTLNDFIQFYNILIW